MFALETVLILVFHFAHFMFALQTGVRVFVSLCFKQWFLRGTTSDSKSPRRTGTDSTRTFYFLLLHLSSLLFTLFVPFYSVLLHGLPLAIFRLFCSPDLCCCLDWTEFLSFGSCDRHKAVLQVSVGWCTGYSCKVDDSVVPSCSSFPCFTMPTISIGRDHLFEALGETYTQDQFEELCFDFGIELDDVTTEKAIIRKERHLDEAATEDEEIIYKIEVPANRYDLLCLEGLAQALRIFLGKDDIPAFKVRELTDGSMLKMHVKHETSLIRPYIVCAVLRGISFNEARYNSFIDLQDKLHQNLCRRRTLVAIGTHDLDTLQGPFTYEALPPPDIKFVPLKQEKEFRADELIEFYRSDLKLKAYLHIIENSPVFPVIYDCKRTVLSLPPIINGAHSAITLNTRNVFIECTATDLTKAKIVLNTMVTMFSRYCESKFEAEPVEVIYPGGKSAIYPDLSTWDLEVDASYICSSVGIVVEENEILNLLRKMQLPARTKDSKILVSVPPTRSDVLHKCDIMEDVAIAFGFNNILKTKPRSLTQGFQQPLNHFSDLLRLEVAMAGFTEVLTWILCSSKENFSMINRRDDGKTAVVIANPRTSDFEVVRTSLLPGILKTTGHNKDHPRPIKIFEVGDVVILDEKKEVGACNQRRLAALYCNSNSGFEVIHGLVDRIMEVVNVPFVSVGDDSGYYIRPSHEPEFFPGRQANIIFRGKSVGAFGIVHPRF